MKHFLPILAIGLALPAVLMSQSADAKYKEIDVQVGGTIKGVAKWKGAIPKLPPLMVFKHMDKCGQTVLNPALVVNQSSKGVKFVAVYLDEEITEGKPLPSKKLTRNHPQVLHTGRDLEQRPDSAFCNFEEHVFPFVRTQSIGLYNMEDLLHNPHAFGKHGQTIFNIALPDRNRLIKKKIRRVRGVTRIQCNTHVHMNGYLLGMNHPYFAVTDKMGRYEITDIPPGTYTIVAWHEGYNIEAFAADNRPIYDAPHVITKRVEIKGGDTVELNWEYPVRDVKVQYLQPKRNVEGH